MKWLHRLDRRRELSDGLPNVPTAKAGDQSWPPAPANSYPEALDGRKGAQQRHLPGWASATSAWEDALLVSRPNALKC